MAKEKLGQDLSLIINGRIKVNGFLYKELLRNDPSLIDNHLRTFRIRYQKDIHFTTLSISSGFKLSVFPFNRDFFKTPDNIIKELQKNFIDILTESEEFGIFLENGKVLK